MLLNQNKQAGMQEGITHNMSHALLRRPTLLADPDYRQFQLNRIRPQVKILGTLASLVLLLMLPWDLRSDSPHRWLAVTLRMVAIIQLYLIALVWQKQWLERNFVPVLMGLALVSFLGLCGNYILLPERTPYLFTVLFYYNIGFLVLAPLATTMHILAVGVVPTLLVYVFLFTIDSLDTLFVPFTLHTIPLLLILNLAAWYIRSMAQEHYRLYRENTELATYDDLTGLLNRRAWESRTHALLARAVRERGPLAVLILDIDHFKTVNDTRGHLAGDEVLRQLATCLKRTLREYDLVGRYGGEEFVVSIAGLEEEPLLALAERLRMAVERHAFQLPDASRVHITMSVGVTCLHEGVASLDAMLESSDKALYRAKQQGRNQVVFGGARARRRLPGLQAVIPGPEPAC